MGATAAIGTMGIGTGLSAFGKYTEGDLQDQMYARNADIAEYQADDAIARGELDAKRMRRRTKQVIGSSRVSMAAQGVDVNQGSAVDTQADAAYLGELDALTIKSNAAKEAWGYKTQAEDLRYKGRLAMHKGKTDIFNTILGGASDVFLKSMGV